MKNNKVILAVIPGVIAAAALLLSLRSHVDADTLVGFGSFEVSNRQARTGRNPQTGKEIKIAEAKVPKFRPGKALKDAISAKK